MSHNITSNNINDKHNGNQYERRIPEPDIDDKVVVSYLTCRYSLLWLVLVHDILFVNGRINYF